MIVGKAAEREFVPQLEPFQLDLRAAPDVAGEQTEQRRFGARGQRAVKFQHARTRPARAICHQLLQADHVGREKALEIPGRRLDAPQREKLPHQRDIRAPGELDKFRAVGDAKFRGQGHGKRLHPGPARVNERAVNIKQDQADALRVRHN